MDTPDAARPSRHPPGSWAPARRLARWAIAPVERFLAVEAASGILLLVAAVIALLWANSPWRDSYQRLWETPLGLSVGPLRFERDLRFWINDGLMTIFFFVVGLEIRRELHRGELSELRRALLPVGAAVGGMAVPALLFALFNLGRPTLRGWGVPTATDIAFAVGVLALLGRRVAPAVRVLLLALAVIDDVGAILVIAVFYSSSFAATGLLILLGGVAGIVVLRLAGVRSPWLYVLPGVVVWAGTYRAGVHPTIAGVIVGLMTPVDAWLGLQHFAASADEDLAGVRSAPSAHAALAHLDRLDRARREAVSPVEQIEHDLHGWVAYGIMPLFALANAGVAIGGLELSRATAPVLAGVSLGLVVGKPVGVLLAAVLLVRLRIAALPAGVGWRQVALVGLTAGIGFTMAIFIAGLAFPGGAALEIAKLGVLVASAAAGVLALTVGRLLLPPAVPAAAAPSAAEAESSTTE